MYDVCNAQTHVHTYYMQCTHIHVHTYAMHTCTYICNVHTHVHTCMCACHTLTPNDILSRTYVHISTYLHFPFILHWYTLFHIADLFLCWISNYSWRLHDLDGPVSEGGAGHGVVCVVQMCHIGGFEEVEMEVWVARLQWKMGITEWNGISVNGNETELGNVQYQSGIGTKFWITSVELEWLNTMTLKWKQVEWHGNGAKWNNMGMGQIWHGNETKILHGRMHIYE